MRHLRYIITANLFLLCFAASAQTVNLSRMERALGKDRIIFTDSTGKQQYRLLRNILDTMITAGNVGSGTTGTIAMWSADTLRNSRITQQDSTITVTPVTGDFPFTFRYRAFGMPYTFYPELRYQWLGFYGDDDVGIKYTGTNTFRMFAGSGSTNRYVIDANASQFKIDGDRDGNDDIEVFNGLRLRDALLTTTNTSNTTHITGLASGNELTKVALGRGMSVAFGASIDTLRSRPGTGNNTYYAVWSGDTLTTGRMWNQADTILYLDGSNDGFPDMTITPSKTTINRPAYTTMSPVATTHLHGLAGLTGTQLAIGSGLSISEGAAVDTLKATSTATTIDTFSLTNDTLRLSLTGDGQPAKIVSLLPSYAQISSYSSEAITATAITKYAPASGWVDFESGDLDAQGSSNQINPNAAMKARITLTASVYMDGGSFAGYVNFYIYKNGSLLTPATYSLGKFDTDEYKVVNINILADLAANDEIDFRYNLSTALGGGTMYMYNPILTVEKL